METAVWEPVDIRLIANSLSIARYLLSVRAASLSPSMSRVRRGGGGGGRVPSRLPGPDVVVGFIVRVRIRWFGTSLHFIQVVRVEKNLSKTCRALVWLTSSN